MPGWMKALQSVVVMLALPAMPALAQAPESACGVAPGAGEWRCAIPSVYPADISIDAVVYGGDAPTGLAVTPDLRAAGADDGAAVLFLIDASDPGRQATVARHAAIASDLAAAVLASGKEARVALATFSGELQQVQAPTTDAAEFDSASRAVAATGLITELYRSVRGAVRLLADVPARSRVLVVFSDGRSEDAAYAPSDVIDAARDHWVRIVGIGEARTVSAIPELQPLRRLAEGTGGAFADLTGGAAPGADLRDALLGLAAAPGVVAHWSLQDVPVGGRAEIRVTGPWGELHQATLAPLPRAGEAPPAAPREALSPVTRLTLGGGSAAAVIAALILILRRRRPYGHLVALSPDGRRYPLRGATTRLGRSDGNEVRLHNMSVSGSHAVVRRHRDGSVRIVDLGATNGVIVDGRRVTDASLNDGAVLELGEVRLRYEASPDPSPATAQEPAEQQS